MRKFSVALAAVVMLAFASCSSDDGYENKTEQSFTDCFHYVQNLETMEAAVYSAPRYTLTFDYGNAKAKIEMQNVKFAEGMPAINMTLDELSWGYNSNSFKVIKATDVVPLVNGEAVPAYMVTSVSVEVLDRYVGTESSSAYVPVVNISFIINNRYQVTAVQKNVLYFGKTQVDNSMSGSLFVSSEPIYDVEIDEDLTADLKISGAKFAEAMPPLDMEFNDIPVEIVGGVGYSLGCESLIPEIGETPYPNYEITALSGAANFSTGINLSFNCMKTFAVTSSLGFWPSAE